MTTNSNEQKQCPYPETVYLNGSCVEQYVNGHYSQVGMFTTDKPSSGNWAYTRADSTRQSELEKLNQELVEALREVNFGLLLEQLTDYLEVREALKPYQKIAEQALARHANLKQEG